MKKVFYIMFLASLLVSAGCSKDDMADGEPKADVNAEAADKIAKSHVACIDMDKLKLSCASARTNAPITLTWDNSRLSYVFNRVYKSYIQIESNGCPKANMNPVNIPIHFFSTSSYTLPEGRNEECFKYRIVIMGYDKGVQACESILPWQVFDYAEQQDLLQKQYPAE